jgi:hypothetical protein
MTTTVTGRTASAALLAAVHRSIPTRTSPQKLIWRPYAKRMGNLCCDSGQCGNPECADNQRSDSPGAPREAGTSGNKPATTNGISYHGDPVMHTNPVKVYFIGYGNWTNGAKPSDSQATVNLMDAQFGRCRKMRMVCITCSLRRMRPRLLGFAPTIAVGTPAALSGELTSGSRLWGIPTVAVCLRNADGEPERRQRRRCHGRNHDARGFRSGHRSGPERLV